MKKRRLYYFALTAMLLFINVSMAQTSPHIEGEVFVDLDTGLFTCSFTLSNVPRLTDFKVLLNKGMNIKHFKNGEGISLPYSGYYNPEIKGESIAYVIKNKEGKENELPSQFAIEYRGAFPKYNDSYNAFDFKGLIAINDKTLRATEQTKWYPVIYDVEKDKYINSYTYKITIKTKEVETIFINGSAPKKTSSAMFSSSSPVPLLLFVGAYDYTSNRGNYILNGNVGSETTAKVFENVRIIQSFLEKKLDREFTDNVYLINHKAVNKRRKGSSWGFNTYPAFAFTGENFFGKIINKDGKFEDSRFRYFCHEFAHNYFGNNVQSGLLFWFWLESFPEYLSFTFGEEVGGREYLKRIVKSKIKEVNKNTFLPLSKITEPDQVGGSYRYSMAPLILLSFDFYFGRDTTYEVLKRLLTYADKETLTLAHFKKASLASGVSNVKYKAFEKKFISNDGFKQAVIDYLSKKFQ